MITESQKKSFIEKDKTEREKAKSEYEQIILRDKDKEFMDALPKEFLIRKSGDIKNSVFKSIDKAFEILNKTKAFEGRIFTKLEIVKYMLWIKPNFHLAWLFIPRMDSTRLWMNYIKKNKEEKLSEKNLDKLYKKFEIENKAEIIELQELEFAMRGLEQSWELFLNRIDVKNGTFSRDIQPNGFPRTGRGNLCYSFIPVKGNYPLKKVDEFKLYNPRTKKDLVYKILAYDLEDEIYKCLSEKGKEVFLEKHSNIENAYSDLHSVNKEIFSGWWNRILISKEI